MGLPTAAIQAGFISRYRADAPLQGLLVGSAAPTWNIFDWGGVPTNQPFPYIVIFPVTSRSGENLSFDADSVDSLAQISVFTQSIGLSQARAIAKRIYDITQKQPLDLSASGFNQFFLLFDSEQEMQEPDGITQMVVHKYRLMTMG